MKHISELTNVSNLSVAKEEKQEQIMLDPLSAQVVDHIFGKFLLLCRGFDALYADRKRLNAEKTQWTSSFSKLGIRQLNQVRFGLEYLEFKHKFPNPPQLAEFLNWCNPTPEEIGLPKLHDAFNEAVRNSYFADRDNSPVWTHDAVYYAKRQIPTDHLTKLPKEKALQIFSYHYEIACRKILNGEELPKRPEPKGLTHEPVRNPEVAKSALAEMKAKLGMK